MIALPSGQLSTWLRELNLPEPEILYTVDLEGKPCLLMLAFPDDQVGIIEEEGGGELSRGGWTLWRCLTEKDVYAALVAVGKHLGIAATVQRLDFSRVQALFEGQTWDSARDTIEELQEGINPEHPDWSVCEEWRKRIRKAKREADKILSQTRPSAAAPAPRISFGLLLKADAERVSVGALPSHNFMGLYTPTQPETPSAIDAVWVAHVKSTPTELWAATAKGHPTAEKEGESPAWELCNTAGLLLEGLLQHLGDRITIVWDAEQVAARLDQWHRHTTGKPFPNTVLLVDLRSLALVAFPTAQRTDRPESLCEELKLPYRDNRGLGGPLAAQAVLLQACADTLGQLNAPLRAALREVLQLSALPRQWLDLLLPPAPASGFEAFITALEMRFKTLAPPVQTSQGQCTPSDMPLTGFFNTGGYLARGFGPEYRPRGGQEAFAHYVDAALTASAPYLLEAGTGIGKTIGYLVPLLLRGQRTFVATHTKNLQDQAWHKDVPTVLAALERAGVGRQVAILKGKGNYVCLHSVVDWLETLNESGLTPSRETWALAGLLHWLMQTQSGWLSEVESLGCPELLARLARDQAPPELRAPWDALDPHARARAAAAEADLVLVNHSYVVALAQYQNPEKADVDTLVFDEAHNLEDVVTEALTLDFAPWTLRHELASLLRRDAKGHARGVLRALLAHPEVEAAAPLRDFRDTLVKLEEGLETWCTQARRRLAEICKSEGDFDPDQPVLFPLSEFWELALLQHSETLAQQCSDLSVAIEAVLEDFSRWPGLPRRLTGSLGSLQQHLEENLTALRSLLSQDNENQVHWAEARVRLDEHGLPLFSANMVEWWALFHSTPIDVATWLHETLPPLYKHRLYVSATLTVGDEFGNIERRLGIVQTGGDPTPVTGVFPSPFKYEEQVLLVVPDDAPTPRSSTDPLYLETISAHIAALVRAAEGRALVLFTSRKAMRQVQIRLQDELESEGIVVLAQSATNRAAIVERFKAAPQTGERLVLLGLRAFWEGVDVPGAALTLLVITRLPFDHFTHPVARARQAHYRARHFDADYFREVVVPATYLHLRQMYGRLIRREDDRGICVLLDPRVVQKPYGRLFLNRLPGSQRAIANTDSVLDCVRRFLRREPLPESSATTAPETPKKLSPEQMAIVQSPAKRILVRAAAGSGKTEVLIRRIIRMITNGHVRPDRILALTFTNKAQDVMRERLSKSLGYSMDLDRNVLTYHQFAARILRQADKEAGTESKFLNENDPGLQESLWEEARRAAELTVDDLPDEDAATVIAYAQNGLVDENLLADAIPALQQSDPFSARLARFFLEYVRRLRDLELLDYGEAIVKAVRVLRENPDTCERWSGRFTWIFCDEYQDTNPAQATLLALVGAHAHLFVVGDSAQSIYSWQGADPDNLRRFEQDFPNTTSFKLSRNYRCFPNLVEVSGHFLEQCGQAQGIAITHDPKRSNDQRNVHYLRSENDVKEAHAIVALVKQALALDVNPETDDSLSMHATVGVLARKWGLLQALEAELIRQEVPYKFEGETARGLLADSGITQIIQRAAELYQRAESSQQLGDTPESRVVRKLREGAMALATELLEAAREILGRSVIEGNNAAQYRHLRELMAGKPARAVLTLPGAGTFTNPVVLSTVHSQKGEEFDTVLVIGLEKGNSPHEPPRRQERLLEWRRIVQRLSSASWHQTLSADDMQRIYQQEEERIFYVAMTRARHNLVVCHADCRNRKPFACSEFLEQAFVPHAVRETSNADEVQIVGFLAPDFTGGYRSDGLVYQTDSGVFVRSKSEMALANEFTRRGIHFEYEQPTPGIAYAFPDFTFPDYGGVVLEHLGLWGDKDYEKRWEVKSRTYETQGLRFLCTTEADIRILQATVDRLQQTLREWAAQLYGEEHVTRIKQLEGLRRAASDLRIGHPLAEFSLGLFEAQSEANPQIVALKVVWEGDEATSAEKDIPPAFSNYQWESMELSGHQIWLGKLVQS